MQKIKHKIVCGYPVNNKTAYAIHTEDFGILMTKEKESFDKAMSDGYIEIEHEDIADCI